MDLRQQVMVNQLAFVAGCGADQAKQLLTAANWHLETALSMFFQEAAVSACQCASNGNTQCQCHYAMCAPSNTPVTPPSFPDALSALAKLSAGGESGSSKVLSPSSPLGSSSCVVTSSVFGSPTSAVFGSPNQASAIKSTQSPFGIYQYNHC